MKLQLVLITVIALMTGACGKQNSKNSGSTRINRYQANQIVSGTTSCQASSWGRIYDETTNETIFRQRVADFSLRNLDEIGNISPLYNSNTGIEFQMTLTFQNGQLIPSTSQASFKISDSITIQENGGYIQFRMGGMGGQAQGGGQFSAQIGDTKGYVRLDGTKTVYQGQQILFGQAYFNNYNQGEQLLGSFVIDSCAAVGI